ncbi:imidazole glycerol phosphate synthase subunit HisH [Rheinheimera sp.]|uniref:imidazole glycerol phosphate synthase subunit HisH n=1 Tax=Rheinheimera sp. TaxID=1869214 RepID=UPI003D2C4EEE
MAEQTNQPQLVIVDTGCANITSVLCALQRLGAEVQISADPAVIRAAEKVIIPGVGTAKQAMANIDAKGLRSTLQQLTQPVLGICLGMQLLTEHSAEGDVTCLGLIPGEVAPLQAKGLRLPHMGWNTLQVESTAQHSAHPLLQGITAADYVYFVHSFAVQPSPYMLASCDYGSKFAAVIGRRNFLGMQFHPERSGKVGARLLQNFLQLDAQSLRAPD